MIFLNFNFITKLIRKFLLSENLQQIQLFKSTNNNFVILKNLMQLNSKTIVIFYKCILAFISSRRINYFKKILQNIRANNFLEVNK